MGYSDQSQGTDGGTAQRGGDRRPGNELAGNLSLYQEPHVIDDSMLDDGVLVGSKYQPVTVRMIEMARSDPSLGAASKLNRDPAFLDELIAQGKTRADEFAAALRFESAWRAGDTDALAGYFADDCEIESGPHFPPLPQRRGFEYGAALRL